ncbi:TonB-dependent receptor [Exilibacterium tricleocarpae]|uniref:TonB-dependent receptor n=2 Tax=Exilibacterium tricleocarpae TaxID=2591008 RepID=A0A545U5V2_9GAMM|nr:TonB-dependent receptor [Exilibacterium tricleocarpae]
MAAVVLSQVSSQARAQTSGDAMMIEEVVVTAVPRAVNKLQASVSVSSINTDDVYKVAPRSIAEVFRSLPGIRAESSGGNGNANITVRGIPLATGGSKYMQIHEDGLPVLEFGDINFGNTDNFTRFDWTIKRIESIRGGSASTLASNSPGGVINMISKTGEEEGGSFGVSFGVDYDELRSDFEYGGEITDGLRFHIGGFVRDGEGIRDTGYRGDNGGQLKFNITKELDNGYIRFLAKTLDDKVTTYLPAPVRVKSNGSFGSVPGFDASTETLHSANTTRINTFDAFGNPRNRDLRDGIESKVDAFGVEARFEIEPGLTLVEKFRNASISGSFIAPFTDTLGDFGPQSAASMAATICANTAQAPGSGQPAIDCSATSVTLANGPGAGDPYSGLAFLNLLFDTSLKDLGNTINDINLTKEFDNGPTVTVGFYYSKQSISTQWNSWPVFIQTVDGSDSQYLDIRDANGTALVDNGLWAPSFLSFVWDLDYTVTAPYLNLGFDIGDDLTIDVSVRRDTVEASGEQIAVCCGGNGDVDLNGDGLINTLQEDADSVLASFSGGVINLTPGQRASQVVNYEADDTFYSLGGTYLLGDNSSVFARYSEGGRAVGDRLLQISNTLNPDGSLTRTTDGYDNVEQLEIGYKFNGDRIDLFATLFDTTTEESQAELTSGVTFVREYDATGLELEMAWQVLDSFDVLANVTWTDAEITSDVNNPALEGNTPRRQADFIYTITPRYETDRYSVGLTLQGSTDYYVQDNNDLEQEGYTLVNLFALWNVTDTLSASFNVNNLTDEFVVTEVEEGTAAAGDIVRARPLSGTSTSVSFRYTF